MALAVVRAAILARITRSAVLDVLREGLRGTARASSRPGARPCRRQAAAQRHDPLYHGDGLRFANLLAGTIVVENAFTCPAWRLLIFQSIANRDLVVVRNCVMLRGHGGAESQLRRRSAPTTAAMTRAEGVTGGLQAPPSCPASFGTGALRQRGFVIGALLTALLLAAAALSLVWTPSAALRHGCHGRNPAAVRRRALAGTDAYGRVHHPLLLVGARGPSWSAA